MKKIITLCLVALFSCGLATAQQPSKRAEKKTVTTEFLTDIDCEGCAKKVTNTIPYEKGVKDVKVDVPTKTVTVTYDPAKTNDANLVKAFAKIKIKAQPKAGECTEACCGEHKHEHKGECKDGCCEKPAKREECKDDCCEGHDHKHEHNHDHGHNHNHDHGHNHGHNHKH